MIKTKLVLIGLILFTSLTSLTAITKVFANGNPLSVFGKGDIGDRKLAKVQEIEINTPSPSLSPTILLTPTKTAIKQSTPTPTQRPLSSATLTATPTTSPPSNLCLVTLQGQQYDVTRLRNTHGGGDIFKCGTDMTSVYQGKHGSSLSRMQAYLYVTGSSQSSPPSTTATPTSTSQIYEDDREDSEHQDRYYEKPEDRSDEDKEDDEKDDDSD